MECYFIPTNVIDSKTRSCKWPFVTTTPRFFTSSFPYEKSNAFDKSLIFDNPNSFEKTNTQEKANFHERREEELELVGSHAGSYEQNASIRKPTEQNKLEMSETSEQNMDYLDIPAFLRRQLD